MIGGFEFGGCTYQTVKAATCAFFEWWLGVWSRTSSVDEVRAEFLRDVAAHQVDRPEWLTDDALDRYLPWAIEQARFQSEIDAAALDDIDSDD